MSESIPPVILFDGVCNLCNASVQWVIRHDKAGVFRMASLQSEAAINLLASRSGHSTENLSSMLVVDGDQIYDRSDASLFVLSKLGLPWRLLAGFRIVPKPIRNTIYKWVARNRYRWFGKQDVCMIPTPQIRARFLDASDHLTS